MKKIVLLFAALLVTSCDEKQSPEGSNSVGDSAEPSAGNVQPVDNSFTPPLIDADIERTPSNTSKKATELTRDEISNLPPLPDTVTKEFIVELWAKPHDDKGLIEEFADGGIREGVWKVVSKRGPRKGELTQNSEAKMILKTIDRRYQVWEWREGDLLTYTVTTYDYDASTYRWWGASASPEETSIFEHSGRRYWRNLMEWKAVNHPDPEIQSTMRTTFISEDGKRFKVVGEAKRNGEVVSYSAGEFTWQSELPEEHRSRGLK